MIASFAFIAIAIGGLLIYEIKLRTSAIESELLNTEEYINAQITLVQNLTTFTNNLGSLFELIGSTIVNAILGIGKKW